MPDRRYRVLAVATHPVQYAAPLFRRMAMHPDVDFEVVYCSLRGAESGHDAEFGADIQWDVPLLDGYRWSQVPNRGSGKESFFGLINPGLWKCIRRGNYDAVLCYVGYVRATFWITCLASKLSNTAFLFGTDASSLAPRDGQRWKAALKKIVWPWLFLLAEQVIVPSSNTLDLMASLGIPAARVTLTPYCVDNEWWIQQASRVDRNATRALWGLSPSDTVFLFCAKLQPWKRPSDVIHAFAQANLSNASLVFAGQGPLQSQLEAEARALGVSSRVRFLGFVNQSRLPAIYASSDLMVLPSQYEPFAVVVNEALCCGCPVAASDRVGAARDLIMPVSPQFLFPCGDTQALAQILTLAHGDKEKLRKVARAEFERMKKWSPEQNISATIEAIRVAASRNERHYPTPVPQTTRPQTTSVSRKIRE